MPKTSSRSHRSTTSRTKTGAAAARSAPAPAPASEPSPEHWRYMAALTELCDSDEDFTNKALARRLGMSTEDLLRFQSERPDVMRWASQRLEADARALAGPLLRRVAELAQAGSVEHADLLLRVASRAWSVVAVPGTGGQAGPFIVNVVVGDHPSNA